MAVLLMVSAQLLHKSKTLRDVSMCPSWLLTYCTHAPWYLFSSILCTLWQIPTERGDGHASHSVTYVVISANSTVLYLFVHSVNCIATLKP